MTELTFQFDDAADLPPSPSEADLRVIPAARGVVLLETATGEPVVLLTAGSMRARVATRLLEDAEKPTSRTRGQLRGVVGRARWIRCGGMWETHWRYLEIAAELWPKSYVSMVTWKPPSWLTLEIESDYPHFRITRDPRGGGECIGPFLTRRDADAFLQSLTDAFCLCRSAACLRKSPHGTKCNHGQMGRCLSPVDGTISMPDYRLALRDAFDFAAGERTPLRDSLQAEMTQAAATLAFEEAAAIKTRLDRLKDFDQPRYATVARLEEFRWLFVERGVGANTIQLFHIRPDKLYAGSVFRWPLEPDQLDAEIQSAHALPANTESIEPLSLLRCSLATRQLHADEARRGIVLHWGADIDAQTLYDRIADWMDLADDDAAPSQPASGEELSSEPSSA